MNWICAVCGAGEHKDHIAKEMMYGMGHEFLYGECLGCGCIQIDKIPENMAQYYPSNYYSFVNVSYKHKPLKVWLKKQLIKYYVYKEFNIIGKIFSFFYPNSEDFYPWFSRIKPKFSADILDVGCGSGSFIVKLRKSGYSGVRGADPFIEKDFNYSGCVTVYKKTLQEISDKFDIIFFNHSLEHMPDQLGVLSRVRQMLKNGGVAVVRIPIAGTYAWRTYGVNWVQFDAPRHFFLHTVKSMELLAKKTGFKNCEVLFDSNALQFWGSEQYVRGIPLRNPKSYAEAPEESIFSKEQIEEFESKVLELNNNKDGDAATFFLYA